MAEELLNVVLVGMMGAGKTYIGKRLARLVSHFSYVDIDEEIEKQEGMTISDIFEKKSEAYFRKVESDLIKKVAKNKCQIISTGGGSFENEENISALKENGVVFYLRASAGELFDRIKDDNSRPMLKDDFTKEKIKQLLKKREKNYMKANFVIDTDKKRAYTILDDVLKEYETNVK